MEQLNITTMITKTIKLDKQQIEWANLSGFSVELLEKHLNESPSIFDIEQVDEATAENEGLSTSHPYRLYNPYNLPVELAKT